MEAVSSVKKMPKWPIITATVIIGVVTEGTAMAENAARFGSGTVVPQQDPGALGADLPADAENARAKVIAALGPATVAMAHEEVYRRIAGLNAVESS